MMPTTGAVTTGDPNAYALGVLARRRAGDARLLPGRPVAVRDRRRAHRHRPHRLAALHVPGQRPGTTSCSTPARPTCRCSTRRSTSSATAPSRARCTTAASAPATTTTPSTSPRRSTGRSPPSAPGAARRSPRGSRDVADGTGGQRRLGHASTPARTATVTVKVGAVLHRPRRRAGQPRRRDRHRLRLRRRPGPRCTTRWNDRARTGPRSTAARTDRQVAYYTALYHSLLHPNLAGDVDGSYFGFDDKVHTATGLHAAPELLAVGHLPHRRTSCSSCSRRRSPATTRCRCSRSAARAAGCRGGRWPTARPTS